MSKSDLDKVLEASPAMRKLYALMLLGSILGPPLSPTEKKPEPKKKPEFFRGARVKRR